VRPLREIRTDESEAVGPEPSTQLAVDRTLLAHDRTMLAWIRTAASLISFGFSIYKFFDLQPYSASHRSFIGPQGFAMLMIGAGLFSLLVAAIQNKTAMTHLRQITDAVPQSSAAGLAAFMAVLGIVAMFAVLLRV
jgi:putative membrane protein